MTGGFKENEVRGTVLSRGVCKSLSFALYFLITAAQVCLWPLPVSSDVYQWTDEKGNTTYSDSPPPGVNPKLKKLRIDKIDRPENPETKGPPTITMKDVSRKRDLRDVTVILYLTDW